MAEELFAGSSSVFASTNVRVPSVSLSEKERIFIMRGRFHLLELLFEDSTVFVCVLRLIEIHTTKINKSKG